MKNDDTKTKKKQAEEGSPQQREGEALFSEKEVRAIVKDFVSAYISGQIKIIFPSADSIMLTKEKQGNAIDFKQAAQIELRIKSSFRELIAVCAGAKEATPAEQEKAINQLFNDVVSLRNGGRIEGVFTEYALEARIGRLEEGIDKINNLVEEIVEWIYRGVVDK